MDEPARSRFASDINHSGEPHLLLNSNFHPTHMGQLQLSESVASHLREQIISGKLGKGEFLRIDAIAKSLNVSTTPVREGLLLLQSESFVRLMPRRGFIVNSFSRADLLDLFWAQATIGGELAARATKLLSKADLAKMQAVHVEHERAVSVNDRALAAKLGHQFHRTINLAAESPRLALLMGSLTKQLPNRFYADIEGQLEDAVQYHPIIMNAIRVKDAEAVRSLMHRHILSGAEHLIEMLEHHGIWGPSSTEKVPPPVTSKPIAVPKTASTTRGAAGAAKTANKTVKVTPARAKARAPRSR